MTSIENAIRDAVEKGWVAGSNPETKDPMMQSMYRTFLDPAFWQALGKARGWGKNIYSGVMHHLDEGDKLVTDKWEMPVYQYQWHHFIDHLASGGDAESFFATLE